MYIGVDGCPAGWIAVRYDDDGYVNAGFYAEIDELWASHAETAETILIDIPIGLRENSNAKRPCDDTARQKLGHPRSSSVFPVPVRAAVQEDSYEAAKATQEAKTDGSLSAQAWAIAEKIEELDTFLRTEQPEAQGVIREAHPEVCLWALNDEQVTAYSKTSQAAAAFSERVDILESADPDVLTHIRDASRDLDADVSLDDVIDAFALALTASPQTGDLQTLPRQPTDDPGDPQGLPMEMVYAHST